MIFLVMSQECSMIKNLFLLKINMMTMANGWMDGKVEEKELKAMIGVLLN